MDVDDTRQRLLARKMELEDLSTLSRNARDAVALDQSSVGRLSRMDAMQQQAMAQATQRQRESELQQIAAALGRLDDGSYGECLDCGDRISEQRLALSPAAPLCIRCASSTKK